MEGYILPQLRASSPEVACILVEFYFLQITNITVGNMGYISRREVEEHKGV